MGALEIGRNECSGKILWDVLHGFMSREQAQTLSKIRRDLIETCGKNIDHVDAVHWWWLGKDVKYAIVGEWIGG